jgi:hypothetical protein
MHLALKCRVKKNKTEDLDDKCKVADIYYLLNTLFCQVHIFLAGKKITPSIAKHAWHAIFEELLNFGKDAKSTHLETSGYKKDTAGEMDSLEKNAGMIARNHLKSTVDYIPILDFKKDILLIM